MPKTYQAKIGASQDVKGHAQFKGRAMPKMAFRPSPILMNRGQTDGPSMNLSTHMPSNSNGWTIKDQKKTLSLLEFET